LHIYSLRDVAKSIQVEDWVWQELSQLKIMLKARSMNAVIASLLIAGKAKKEKRPMDRVAKELAAK
jgi:hypothetical protein